MGIKIYALLLYLPKPRERKNLEPAGIGQNRPVPHHKFVQPAKLFNHLIPGSYMEMIGI